jgi:hypothetical protein
MTINDMLLGKWFRASASKLTVLVLALLPAASLAGEPAAAADRDDKPPDALIGYTELRTNLPGGRAANIKTERAVVVKADGTGRRVLAEELTREAGYWTQFVGWSPDGKAASLYRGWVNEENAKWEEEHKTFRSIPDNGRSGGYLVDLASGKATKRTPVEEKKSELIKNLVHGRSISPDGKRCAFEDPAYRLCLADADGSNAKQVETGLRFHLIPRGRRTARGCSFWPANTTTATRTSSRPTARS